ncbi:hypothetical protein MNBD_GAMMA12-2880 [hydrothermal vent metagenome]|uniref:Uncharacterized protein n=1 Tax=hydrothermal vent metagenome TaxID=652676 RepID=A0A3B0YCW1_9ZZZZ
MKMLGILLALFGGAALVLPELTNVADIAFNWMGSVGGAYGAYIPWAFVGVGVLMLIIGMMKGSSSNM